MPTNEQPASERFQQAHSAALERLTSAHVLVAHVTVGGETVTVAADKIYEALLMLKGLPVPDLRLNADIRFDAITSAELEALSRRR